MIKNLFFDLDDTLISFAKAKPIAIREIFENHGLCFDEKLVMSTFESINNPLWKALERGEITSNELRRTRWQKLMQALSLPQCDAEEFEASFRIALSHTAELEDGAVELLKYLKQKGYKIYIASNSFKSQQQPRLELAGISKYVDGLYCSQDVGYEKPDKRFFEAVLDDLGAKVSESVMIGDSLTADIAGGKTVNMKTLWYNPSQKEDTVGADGVVSQLSDIMEIL